MNMQQEIAHIARVAEVIREALGDDDDAQALLDTLEGETNVMDLIGTLLLQEAEAKVFEAGVREVVQKMTARARRYKARAEACRQGLVQIMGLTGQKKLVHPLATLSMGSPSVSVEITKPEDIPRQLCTWTPDKTSIRRLLEAREDVPGAVLKEGDPRLTVRIA